MCKICGVAQKTESSFLLLLIKQCKTGRGIKKDIFQQTNSKHAFQQSLNLLPNKWTLIKNN